MTSAKRVLNSFLGYYKDSYIRTNGVSTLALKFVVSVIRAWPIYSTKGMVFFLRERSESIIEVQKKYKTPKIIKITLRSLIHLQPSQAAAIAAPIWKPARCR
jgi:hypothetical protein